MPQPFDNPTDELKIYELSLIWKEAAYNFAFWEGLMPKLDWDKAYREALPAVLRTQCLYDYYKELAKFVALLRDGHTNIYMPEAIIGNPSYGAKLPIYIRYINGEYVVSDVKRSAGDAVRPWSIIKKINGMDSHAYVKEHIFPYLWHEKLDSADSGIFDMISSGAAGSTVDFELDDEGKSYTVTLTRAMSDNDWLFADTLKMPEDMTSSYQSDSHTIATTKDNIAVIKIDTMMNNDLPQEFYANFPLLQKARGCIIDIRMNSGGDSSNSDAVAAAFIGGEFVNQRSLHPIHIGAYKAWGVFQNFGDKTYDDIVAQYGPSEWWEKTYKIPRQSYYEESVSTSQAGHACPGILTVPLVVLTTAYTGSAAEDFLVVLEHAKRATFVGTASFGSTGQPLNIDLESGGSVRICTRHNTHIDGRAFINTGVAPHVHFEPSMGDLRSGVDTHMGKGLEVLRGML